MDKLIIEATDDRPSIIIDPEKKLLKISGSSYPENAAPTYSPIIKWLTTHQHELTGKLHCDFFFNYINSASKKSFYELLIILDQLQQGGLAVDVSWNYDIYDDDMLEMGREFLGMIGIPYKLIPHE